MYAAKKQKTEGQVSDLLCDIASRNLPRGSRGIRQIGKTLVIRRSFLLSLNPTYPTPL